MSTINFTSDVTAKELALFTKQADSHAYIIKAEHSDALPSTATVRRKLAGTNGSVRRTYVTRTRYVTIGAGTEDEHIAPIVAKTEYSIPVGALDADVVEVRDDMNGLIVTAEVTEVNKYGILPAS